MRIARDLRRYVSALLSTRFRYNPAAGALSSAKGHSPRLNIGQGGAGRGGELCVCLTCSLGHVSLHRPRVHRPLSASPLPFGSSPSRAQLTLVRAFARCLSNAHHVRGDLGEATQRMDKEYIHAASGRNCFRSASSPRKNVDPILRKIVTHVSFCLLQTSFGIA